MASTRRPKWDTEEPSAPADLEPAPEGEPVPADPQPDAPAAPRPPQGIILRKMNTGDPRKDLHPLRKRRLIDPACLKTEHGSPFLAMPILDDNSDTPRVRIRQVDPVLAAEMLTCDLATGGPSTYRLATDAEVEAYFKDMEARSKRPGRG